MPKATVAERIALTGTGEVKFRIAQALIDDYLQSFEPEPVLVIVLTAESVATDITFKIAEWCVECQVPFELHVPQVELWMKEVAEGADRLVEYKSDDLQPYFDVSSIIMAWNDEDPLGEHIVYKAWMQNCKVLDLTDALKEMDWDPKDPAPKSLTPPQEESPVKKPSTKRSTASTRLREVVKADPAPEDAEEPSSPAETTTEADPFIVWRGEFGSVLSELVLASTALTNATNSMIESLRGVSK